MKINASCIMNRSPLSHPWCRLSSAVAGGVKVRRAFVHDGHVSLSLSPLHSHVPFPPNHPSLPLSLDAARVGCRSGNIHNASSCLLMDRAFQLHQHCGRVQRELWRGNKAYITLEPFHRRFNGARESGEEKDERQRKNTT